MRILLAPDKFKGTYSARQAAYHLAVRLGTLRPDFILESCPVADGGEGTLDSLEIAGAVKTDLDTVNALGRPVRSPFARGQNRQGPFLAFESATCLSLAILPPSLRNPLHTSSYGLGLLIRRALEKQSAPKIIVGLGGTATVDGGAGFLSALGAVFQDSAGPLEYPPRGGDLGRIRSIDLGMTKELLKGIRLEAWCDVVSPLLGPKGAAHLFGPQKGASPHAVQTLEKGMECFASLLEKKLGRPLREEPGAGSAGGLGLAVSALGGTLCRGFDAVADTLGLEEKIKSCDAVITGEGRLDASTRQGKAPWGVKCMADRYGKPCFVVAGQTSDSEGGWAGEVLLLDHPGDIEGLSPSEWDLRWDHASRRLAEMLDKVRK